MDPELQKHLKKLVGWSTYAMILLTVYLLFVYVFPLIMSIAVYFPVLFLPFIFAVLLALIIEPVVNIFEKYARFKRQWAVLASLVLVVAGFILVTLVAVTAVIREMSSLYHLAASRSDQVIGQVMQALQNFQLYYIQLNLPPQVESAVQDNLQNGLELLQRILNSSINALMQGLIRLPGLLIFLTIAVVATFLIIKDRALIRTFVINILPASQREKSSRVVNDLLKALSGFVKAYSLLISITAAITMLALKILGIEYAFTLGIIVGLLDILPVVGPGALMLPWIIWESVSGHPGMAISLLGIYMLISVTRQILEPKIVGDSIGLHPLATLISLYAGLQLGGALGMIMGPVTVVIFIACYRAGLLDRWDWRVGK